MTEKVFSGFNFHTALRKSLDSKASAICWNAINLVNNTTWDALCATVQRDTRSLKDRWLKLRISGLSAMNLLGIGLGMLTDDEWEVLEKYPFQEEE